MEATLPASHTINIMSRENIREQIKRSKGATSQNDARKLQPLPAKQAARSRLPNSLLTNSFEEGSIAKNLTTDTDELSKMRGRAGTEVIEKANKTHSRLRNVPLTNKK